MQLDPYLVLKILGSVLVLLITLIVYQAIANRNRKRIPLVEWREKSAYEKEWKRHQEELVRGWKELDYFEAPNWVRHHIDTKLFNLWDHGKEQIVTLKGRTFLYMLLPSWVKEPVVGHGPWGEGVIFGEEDNWSWRVYRKRR